MASVDILRPENQANHSNHLQDSKLQLLLTGVMRVTLQGLKTKDNVVAAGPLVLYVLEYYAKINIFPRFLQYNIYIYL